MHRTGIRGRQSGYDRAEEEGLERVWGDDWEEEEQERRDGGMMNRESEERREDIAELGKRDSRFHGKHAEEYE